MNVATLFGAPLALQPEARTQWIAALTVAWTALLDRPPAGLDTDLDALASYFGPGASPRKIRSRVTALPSYDARFDRLPDAVVTVVDGLALITPEGRILLEVLLELDRTEAVAVHPDEHLAALDTAVRARTQWQRQWLHKQFRASLSAPVVGAGLFLAINGSVGATRALLLPKDESYDRELGDLILPIIGRFSQRLGGRQPDAERGVRSSWVFTQLSRLLPRDIARERSDNPAGTIIFIRVGRDAALVEEMASRLASFAPATVQRAVSELVADYRSARGKLTALGLMHEDPTTTRRITAQLAGAGSAGA
ncbi:hypothetical protein A5669_27235 [Mycolicibacterium fortuitum]|uniref:hypothetical protein n=1 Tax=Mycolicibacterium fortuitum TaxID=1766 RepID=UPI0007EAA70C|nr:hypothetical protein [Mycolicibacterium fortuitum]OBG51050.1 hypothetical protein A5669_27235 [Mycolicibacterium fortuitum]